MVYAQNHDQIGNRARGRRLWSLTSFERAKLAAGTVLLSPYLPMLFMGEEYGETAPFLYFVDHSDPALIDAVRNGRRAAFGRFWQHEPPDPQDEATFRESRCQHHLAAAGRHRAMRAYYAALLRLRRDIPALRVPDKKGLEALPLPRQQLLVVRRAQPGSEVLFFLHFGHRHARPRLPAQEGLWRLRLDSFAPEWDGPGSHAPAELTPPRDAWVPLAPAQLLLYERVEAGA